MWNKRLHATKTALYAAPPCFCRMQQRFVPHGDTLRKVAPACAIKWI